MAKRSLLVGDLGGTNARFALAQSDTGSYDQDQTLRCADFNTAVDAMDAYLEQVGAPIPRVICLAVAGPVKNNAVRFLNNNWQIDAAVLSERFDGARVQLVNDFEAVAHSLPLLTAEHLETIGPVEARVPLEGDFTVGVLGPGTGLGVAGLLRRGNQAIPIGGEGGHTGFAPETGAQVRVLKALREKFERVSAERLLSGPGVENIYWALQQIHGVDGGRVSAAEVFSRALANEDPIASETVQLFYEGLGQVAGDLALKLGATDGIFIAGGIAQRYPELLKSGAFRSGFENKGRHRSLVERVPTLLMVHPQPGLLGASEVARRLGRGQRQGRMRR